MSEADRTTGDAVALREALRNVIDNAVRHGAAEGCIDVTVRAESTRDGTPRIVILVDDDGPGIRAACRSAALEHFVSLDLARTAPDWDLPPCKLSPQAMGQHSS